MIQIESPQTQTSRTNLIAAFRRVVASTGRRQATDLHVRRLLCYIRAKDVDGQGAQRSLKQIANRLVLSVPTCRRVIRRAVKRFGLLIVIPQRHTPGGQSVNRYTINWKNVATILGMTTVSSSAVQFARLARTRARSKRISESRATLVSCSAPGSTDVLVGSSDRSESRADLISRRSMPVRLAPEFFSGASSCRRPEPAQRISGNSSEMPVRLAPPVFTDQADNTFTSAARTRARSNRIHSSESRATLISRTDLAPPVPYDQALDNTICPSGSDPFGSHSVVPRPRTACPLRSAAGLHHLPVRLAPRSARTPFSSHPVQLGPRSARTPFSSDPVQLGPRSARTPFSSDPVQLGPRRATTSHPHDSREQVFRLLT